MEFLKVVLGDDLYKQIEEKINGYNGDEENKEKQIKLGNLATGQYVDKRKYEDSTGSIQKELDAANALIEELKKSNQDDGSQEKIAEYETEVENLKNELADTKIKSAIKVALLSEKPVDVDYLTWKLEESLKESGEALELDGNDNIKGWDSRLTELKTKFPKMFEGAGGKKVDVNKLPGGDGGDDPEPESLEDAIKQQFEKE